MSPLRRVRPRGYPLELEGVILWRTRWNTSAKRKCIDHVNCAAARARHEHGIATRRLRSRAIPLTDRNLHFI